MAETTDKEESQDQEDNPYCKVTCRKSECRVYDAFISDKIESPCYYTKLITVLRGAAEDDTVNIYVNSGGGDMMTTFQILGAIAQAQCDVKMYVDGEVGSAAGMLVLGAVDCEIYISPYGSMMCHAFSTGNEPMKRHELKSSVDFYHRHLSKKIREIYEGFLTKDEIELMLEGKDFYFDAKELNKRLKARGVKKEQDGGEWTKARRP